MARRLVIGSFVLLLAFTAIAAVVSLFDALEDPTPRAWLDVAYMTLKLGVVLAFTVFVVKRDRARRRTRKLSAFIVCTAAMLAVIVLQRPDASTSTAVVIAGELLAVVAGAWMLVATVTLGRCFGVLPEARGLVTHGPYRFVRHPLYLGEFGTCAGLVIASPSGRNLFAALVFTLAQAARMRMEERELTRQFPEYADYAKRTPRLIPQLRTQGDPA